MKAYIYRTETQWGPVDFIYNDHGLTIILNGKEIKGIPAAVKKQTTQTILKKLPKYIKE